MRVSLCVIAGGVLTALIAPGGATRTNAGVSDTTSIGAPGAPPRPAVVVALDPGHGGTNLGAPGPARGLFEKHVTLALADRIRALLAHEAGVTVVLCREADVLVPVRARARCARASGADLFLSLHTSEAPPGQPRGSVSGFEVYLLGPGEIEDDVVQALRGARDEADAIWRAHEVRAAAERSAILARVVAHHLAAAPGASPGRGVKQAGAALDVLRGVSAPSVLVEIGFLDNADEGARLASPAGREPIARALAAAVLDFARTPAPAVQGSPQAPAQAR